MDVVSKKEWILFAATTYETADWKKSLSVMCAASLQVNNHSPLGNDEARVSINSSILANVNTFGASKVRPSESKKKRKVSDKKVVRNSLMTRNEILQRVVSEEGADESALDITSLSLPEKVKYFLQKIASNSTYDEDNENDGDVDNTKIPIHHLENLVGLLEPTFHPRRTVDLICRDMRSNFVHIDEFTNKWVDIASGLNEVVDKPIPPLHDRELNAYTANSAGFQKSQESLEKTFILPDEFGFEFQDMLVGKSVGLSHDKAIHFVGLSLRPTKKLKLSEISRSSEEIPRNGNEKVVTILAINFDDIVDIDDLDT